MNRLASVLERLSRAQPSPAHREVFKAPDFTGEGNVEYFLQQFQEVAVANEWSEMAILLHTRTHLKNNASKCWSHATLKEVFEAFRSKYELTVRKARTLLNSLKRDTKLFLTDHATEVKRLVEAAFTNLPQTHRQETILDLFCNSLNHAYLQKYWLALKPKSLSEAVKAGNEYFQMTSNSNPELHFGKQKREKQTPSRYK